MLEDIRKEARKLDICNQVDERITTCIKEIIVIFESSGALSTSDKTQLHLALITYVYWAGTCYDVEILNFIVQSAVPAIVQLDQSNAGQDEFEINTEHGSVNWKKNKRTVQRFLSKHL